MITTAQRPVQELHAVPPGPAGTVSLFQLPNLRYPCQDLDCAVCGGRIPAAAWRAVHDDQHFCSASCIDLRIRETEDGDLMGKESEIRDLVREIESLTDELRDRCSEYGFDYHDYL